MTAEAFKFEPAYEAVCFSCGDPVTVSTAALETCKRMNHILKRMGEKLMSKAEIALCRPCNEIRYEKMWAQERAKSEAYERMWSNFRKAYRSAPDDRRDALESDLQRSMGDYWSSYKALLTAWKAELATKRARSGSGGTTAAGF